MRACGVTSLSVALRDTRGQGTVEAAFVIPILFITMLLLIQPGIILYDRMVMNAACAEGCRVLATSTDAYGSGREACEAFVRHRLASIPPQDCFHVHDAGCTWEVSLVGDESSDSVTVSIKNQVKPLPLFDGAATLAGMTNANGYLEINVSRSMATQPAWALQQEGSPQSWIGAWL